MHELYTTFCLNLIFFHLSYQNDQCFTVGRQGAEIVPADANISTTAGGKKKKKRIKERIAGE